MTIGWIEISQKKYGGIVYNEIARSALSKDFKVDLILSEAKIFKNIRYLKIPESFFYLSKLKGEKDLWIRDFYSTITLPLDKTVGKNLVVVHHVDFSTFPIISRPVFFFLKKYFYRNLKKADAILTVSDYWKNHFLERGYKNIYKIYNGFNLSDFNISEQEVLEFLEKRKKYLEGVCITGGEPLLTLEKDFLKKIKSLGYKIKLDTNGSFPEKLGEFISEGLIDFVAMDIKSSKENYQKVSNSQIEIEKIEKSIKIISKLGNYEFPGYYF